MHFAVEFDMAELRPLIAHAKKAKTFTRVLGYENETGPALVLVKDKGVYMMSAAKGAKKVVYGKLYGKGSHRGMVARTEGKGDRITEHMDGDDWVERIGLNDIHPEHSALLIKVTDVLEITHFA